MKQGVAQLALAQAILLSVTSLMVTAGAIIGSLLTSNPALASLPLAIQFLAVTVTTIPASLLMQAIGRRAGFLIASVIGVAGAICAALAIYLQSFSLFCIGTLGTGVYTAFGHYIRFAATEVARPEQKNTALGYVMAGGVVAAFVGPNLAHLSKDVFAVAYLGTMLSVIVMYGLNVVNFWLIKLPPPRPRHLRKDTRPMRQILKQPEYVAAVASGTVGYSVMVLLMTATPLEMTHLDHDFGDVAFVIQWHVLGMFLPSFVTGHLINRWGAPRIILCGIALMLLCIGINLNGTSVSHFWIALTLLGVGWNFMFIGGTSLLGQTHALDESAKAQAFNDFVVFSTAALSSLAAGALLHWLGWQRINLAALPVLTIAGSALLLLYIQRRRFERLRGY